MDDKYRFDNVNFIYVYGWRVMVRNEAANRCAEKGFSTRWELAHERVMKNFTLKGA